jgi:hypothetical protein
VKVGLSHFDATIKTVTSSYLLKLLFSLHPHSPPHSTFVTRFKSARAKRFIVQIHEPREEIK